MKTNQQIAVEVIAGKWGNGFDRRNKLISAGYNPDAVQTIVNALMESGSFPGEGINITGTETMNIDVDLSKYGSITLNFLLGDNNG